MTDAEKIKQLSEALQAAKEHLEYCGYGDSYEREGARLAGLPEKIDAALALAPVGVVEVQKSEAQACDCGSTSFCIPSTTMVLQCQKCGKEVQVDCSNG